MFSQDEQADVLQIRVGGEWTDVERFEMKEWNRVEVEMGESNYSVAVNGSAPKTFDGALLRKVCFGGLYEKPEWPMGMARSCDVQLRLDTIEIE